MVFHSALTSGDYYRSPIPTTLTCEGCNEPIAKEQTPILPGEPWHQDCWRREFGDEDDA